MERAVIRRGLLSAPGVTLSETALDLPKELSFEVWRDLGLQLGRAEHSISWWVGDWWAFGEHHYGERKAIVESEDWNGPAFQTCRNAGSVCAAFETSRRRDALSFTHHAEVASLDPGVADVLLDEAEREGWTFRELRFAIKRQRRSRRERDLGERQLAAPERRYGVILADPPWRFEVRSRETGMDRAADNHYPTMTTEDVVALEVPAADDCVLFLWVTVPFDAIAHEVLRAWDFKYASQFVWVKHKIGTGYWSRNKHEMLFIAVRGLPPAPAMGTQFESVIEAAARAHSVKPERAYEIIEAYFPTLPKLEMFARGEPRPGWDRWGLEA